jgi:replicative DNA helicase
MDANIEAEQALLGIALCDNVAARNVCDRLRPEHFATPLHARLFEAIA